MPRKPPHMLVQRHVRWAIMQAEDANRDALYGADDLVAIRVLPRVAIPLGDHDFPRYMASGVQVMQLTGVDDKDVRLGNLVIHVPTHCVHAKRGTDGRLDTWLDVKPREVQGALANIGFYFDDGDPNTGADGMYRLEILPQEVHGGAVHALPALLRLPDGDEPLQPRWLYQDPQGSHGSEFSDQTRNARGQRHQANRQALATWQTGAPGRAVRDEQEIQAAICARLDLPDYFVEHEKCDMHYYIHIW